MNMKIKITALLLALVLLCPVLAACGTEKAEDTAPAATLTETVTEEAEETEEFLPKRLKVDQVTSLPIADEKMSSTERRQLVLDYFELQLSFHWIPDMDLLDYPTTYFKKYPKTIEMDTIYGGIPYQSTGNGNLYRWLEYYDEDTGIFHMSKAFAENGGYGEGAAVTGVKKDDNGNVTYKKYRSLQVFFNQCSVASYWGWGRVINSANFIWTSDMNVYNGFIPVGGFTYGYTDYNGNEVKMETIRRFGELDTYNEDGTISSNSGNPGFLNSKGKRTALDTKHVISNWNKANGDEAFYDCYAKMRPGDCVVSGGHAMMIKSVTPITTVRADGSSTLAFSEVIVIEQIEGWGQQSTLYGKDFKNQGGVDRKYTFSELQGSNYIPFTFAEYLDENDPEDKEYLEFYKKYSEVLHPIAKRYPTFGFTNEEVEALTGIGIEKGKVFTTLEEGKTEVSFEEFEGMTLGANYSISDVFVSVTDKDGKELLRNVHRTTTAQVREVSMKARKSTWEYDKDGNSITISNGLKELAGKGNTVTVTVQISNGEKLVAFQGILK